MSGSDMSAERSIARQSRLTAAHHLLKGRAMDRDPRGTETMIGYAPFEIGNTKPPERELVPSEPAVIVSELVMTDSLTTWGWSEPRTVAKPKEPDASKESKEPTEPKDRNTQVVALYPEAGSSKLPFVIAAIAVVVCAGAATYLWCAADSTSSASVEPAPSVPVPVRVPVAAAKPAPAVKVTPAPPPPITPKHEAASVDRSVAVSHGSCSIRVDANVAGGIVMIDGRAVGSAPIQIDGLYCGHRTRVAVVDPALAPWERSINPEEGTVVQVHASLGRLTTAIAVTSIPNGATVTVNGREVGVTPAAIPVVVGATTKLRVSSPGYAPYDQTIVPRAGTSPTIAATLTR